MLAKSIAFGLRMCTLIWASTCVLAFCVMVTALCLQIVSRHLVQLPVLWTSEISLLAFNWVVFVGGLGAIARHDLICMDAVTSMLPPKANRRISILNACVLGLVAIFLLPAIWRVLVGASRFSLNMSGLPLSYNYIPGAIFFVLLPVVLLVGFLRPSHQSEVH